MLVPNANPATSGLAVKTGEVIRIRMPAEFKRNDQLAVKADADTNLVFTKGCPPTANRCRRVKCCAAVHSHRQRAAARSIPAC